jgi:hypothetical protein
MGRTANYFFLPAADLLAIAAFFFATTLLVFVTF